MKKGWFVVIVLAVLYFLYLGKEAETPEYNIIEYSFQSDSGRVLGLTLAEKLPPGKNCRDGLMTGIGHDLKQSCGGECRIVFSKCGLGLTPTLRRAFDNELMNDPYLSYEKGGILPQQDFRLIYTGLDRAEAEGACVDIREMLGNDALYFIGGRTECIRRSITR